MVEFLTTTAVNYRLEELIKDARERVILISPFLKINHRLRELMEDKDRLKIDMRIVYGKSELQPEEVSWLRKLAYVRTSYCENLHAKCYMSEDRAIITSMNLYEFSQINNNEMGVLVQRDSDTKIYKDIYEEAQRLIRISDEVRLSVEKVSQEALAESEDNGGDKLTTSRLAKLVKLKTTEAEKRLNALGYLDCADGKYTLSEKGKSGGGEERYSKQKGDKYFLWPKELGEEL